MSDDESVVELTYGNPLLISVGEACALLGISRYFVLKMIEKGDLVAVRYGEKTWVRRDSIEPMLERYRVAS